MAAKKSQIAGVTDQYGQFKGIISTTSGDSDELIEEEVNTGLSIRGALVWLIHQAELYFDGNLTANFLGCTAALTTRRSLSAMPNLNDDGVIFKWRIRKDIAGAAGSWGMVQPWTRHFLPPVPLASPRLNLYVQGDADHADGRNIDIETRLLFTTAALSADMYTEIAETWGW